MIYLATGDSSFRQDAFNEVVLAARDGGVFVSPVSAWEIGMLAAKKRVVFLPNPTTWFQNFLNGAGVRLQTLSPEEAIASSFLPRPIRADPADRLLIATARALNVPIVTRDRLILDWAKAGHVQTIEC